MTARTLARRLLARTPVDVRPRHNVPFGVRWTDDLRFFLQGRSLRVAFDVGAHFGETALLLTSSFPGVEVHSFEPLPASYEVLRGVGDTTVHPVNAAVSEHSGTIKLAVGTRNTGRTGVGADGPTVDVPSISLDDYVAENSVGPIDLLKIDVESHESAVLRGARGLLGARPPEYILCECEFIRRNDEPHGDFHEIFGVLAPLGYRIVSIYTGGVDNLGWLWGDVLFRHVTAAEREAWYAMSPHQSRRDISGD